MDVPSKVVQASGVTDPVDAVLEIGRKVPGESDAYGAG